MKLWLGRESPHARKLLTGNRVLGQLQAEAPGLTSQWSNAASTAIDYITIQKEKKKAQKPTKNPSRFSSLAVLKIYTGKQAYSKAKAADGA